MRFHYDGKVSESLLALKELRKNIIILGIDDMKKARLYSPLVPKVYLETSSEHVLRKVNSLLEQMMPHDN